MPHGVKIFDKTNYPMSKGLLIDQGIMMVVQELTNLIHQLQFKVGCKFGLLFLFSNVICQYVENCPLVATFGQQVLVNRVAAQLYSFVEI